MELPVVSRLPPASDPRLFEQREAVPRTADIPGDIGCASGLTLKMQRNTLLCNPPITVIPKSDIDSGWLKPKILLGRWLRVDGVMVERIEPPDASSLLADREFGDLTDLAQEGNALWKRV